MDPLFPLVFPVFHLSIRLDIGMRPGFGFCDSSVLPFLLSCSVYGVTTDHPWLFVCWAAQWGAISSSAKIPKHRESLSLFRFTHQTPSSATLSLDNCCLDQNPPKHTKRIVGRRCFLSSSPLCGIKGHLCWISPLQVKLICSDLQRVWPPIYVDEPQYSWTHL